MKWEKDKRVNAGYWSLKEYLLLFFALAALNGFHMVIFTRLLDRGMIQTHTQLVINILGVYVLAMAALYMALVSIVRYFLWNRPMRIVGEAAKKIAKGDFSIRIAPLRKDGKKDYAEVMFEDFNTMVQELASIETMKTDFIANVSHEIKTPLAVIQNYAAALQNDALGTEDRHEYIKTIISSSQKLSALVSNILKLNKLENEGILPEASSYELGEQLRRCALAFEDLWERKNIDFDADLDEAMVRYDESMLEIIWNNLIANAIKFTPRGGSITLTLRNSGDFAEVRIADTGCGISEETKKHIFDKFYQGDSSHSQEGTGLGLALVKRAIEIIGAGIEVESKTGEGAAFTVKLKTVPPPPHS